MSAPAPMLMTPRQIAEHKLPPDRVWHSKQESAFDAAGNGDILIAFDYQYFSKKKNAMVTVKAYSHLTPDELLTVLQNTPSADNHVYELIRGKCKGYFDIEKTIAAPDLVVTSDDFLAELLPALRAVLSEKIGPDVEFAVLEGSRSVGNAFKLSFHVILTNIAMASNDDGGMKDIAKALDAKVPGCVDLGVYTKHRVFRCPFATKLGSNVGLTPLMSASSPSLRGLSTADFVRKSLVTVFDDSVRNFVPQHVAHSGGRRADAAADREPKRRRMGGDGGSAAIDENYDELKKCLQQLIRRCGDTNTDVAAFGGVESNGKLSFTCSNNKVRYCLLDPETILKHESNNCKLFLTAIGDNYVVEYHCFSPLCPAVAACGRSTLDMGALVRIGATYEAYPGRAAANRMRLNMPVQTFLPALPELPMQEEVQALIDEHIDASVDAEATSVLHEARIIVESMHTYDSRVMHKYDGKVLGCLVQLAKTHPVHIGSFKQIFVDYHLRTAPIYYYAAPTVWQLWKVAYNAPSMDDPLQTLRGVATQQLLANTDRYVKGILFKDHATQVVIALDTLKTKHPEIAADLQSLSERVRTIAVGTMEPDDEYYKEPKINPSDGPYEVLRALYVANRSYCVIRAEFMHDHCFVSGIHLHVRVKDRDVRYSKHTELTDSFRHIKYREVCPRSGELIRRTFVTRYIDEENKHIFTEVGLDPACIENQKSESMFNTWGGFLAADYDDMPPEVSDARSQLFFDHLFECWACGKQEIYDFIVKMFAWMVQRPHVKTDTCVVLYGACGTGKDAPLRIMTKHVLGTHIAVNVTDPDNQIFCTYGCEACNKILVHVSDVKSTVKYNELFKNYVDAPTIRLEMKFKEAINLKNYANFFFSTNHKNSFAMDQGERRILFLETSAKSNDPDIKRAYWNDYHFALDNPEAGAAIYQRLLRVDLSSFSMATTLQMSRPQTDLHRELTTNSISDVAYFLSGVVNMPRIDENQVVHIKISTFAELAAMNKGDQQPQNVRAISKEIKAWIGDCSYKGHADREYVFTLKFIKQKLDARSCYDPDADLHSNVQLTLNPVDAQSVAAMRRSSNRPPCISAEEQ